MRTVLCTLAAAAAMIATPALAEGRAEARGGVIWGGGESRATVGAAVGYDFSMGPGPFIGAEVSGDKILDGDADRVAIGITGRVGVNAGPAGKIYGAGGYTTKPCEFCSDSWHAGAGYQHGFGPLYGKVEYRHFFTKDFGPDSDAVMAGIGVRF